MELFGVNSSVIFTRQTYRQHGCGKQTPNRSHFIFQCEFAICFQILNVEESEISVCALFRCKTNVTVVATSHSKTCLAAKSVVYFSLHIYMYIQVYNKQQHIIYIYIYAYIYIHIIRSYSCNL